ncbi:hypothetical protein QR680_006357 [Steinernema hermaphroditum]|uniref:G-protein coupled receptors family 1 profile domain-containing protein n=1 Tax=Steinernema hermaphroditum TaxID=289476 RepID=A0AA39HWD9_9BILA|nr:hypothetical protein QR680_006357 [Steinernema hermaphroditum]
MPNYSHIINHEFDFSTTVILTDGFFYTAAYAVILSLGGVLLNSFVLRLIQKTKIFKGRYKISLFWGTLFSFLACCCVFTICSFYLFFYLSGLPANFIICCAIQKINYMFQVPFFFALFVTSVDRYLSVCHKITLSERKVKFCYPLVFIVVALYLGSLFIYNEVVKDDVCVVVVQFPAWLLRTHLNTYCFLAITAFVLSLRTAHFVFTFKKKATNGIVQVSGVRTPTEKRLLYSVTLQAILPIFFIVPFLLRSQLVSFNVQVNVAKSFIDFVRVLTYSYYAFNSLIVIFTVHHFRHAVFSTLKCAKTPHDDSTKFHWLATSLAEAHQISDHSRLVFLIMNDGLRRRDEDWPPRDDHRSGQFSDNRRYHPNRGKFGEPREDFYPEDSHDGFGRAYRPPSASSSRNRWDDRSQETNYYDPRSSPRSGSHHSTQRQGQNDRRFVQSRQDSSGTSSPNSFYRQIQGALVEKEKPKPRRPTSSATSSQALRISGGNAWGGATSEEKERIDRSVKLLSMVTWGLEDANNPQILPRKNLQDHSDHVRLLRPVIIDGMSISVVYNRHRPFLFDGSMNRLIPSRDYFEVLSTKAFILLLHYYMGRGHLARVIVPQSYIDNYLTCSMTDDPEVFEELLDSGLVSSCRSFEHLLQLVDEREACLVMDVAEYHRFYKNLPEAVKDRIGICDKDGKKRSANFVDLSNRFVQPYFVGPERRPILPADSSISYDYSWMDDRMTQNSLIHSTTYKKMFRHQMSFDEQIKWLSLCDRLLKSDRQLTETKRFDLLMEEYDRRLAEGEAA